MRYAFSALHRRSIFAPESRYAYSGVMATAVPQRDRPSLKSQRLMASSRRGSCSEPPTLDNSANRITNNTGRSGRFPATDILQRFLLSPDHVGRASAPGLRLHWGAGVSHSQLAEQQPADAAGDDKGE